MSQENVELHHRAIAPWLRRSALHDRKRAERVPPETEFCPTSHPTRRDSGRTATVSLVAQDFSC
jgi:hypothetical protein